MSEIRIPDMSKDTLIQITDARVYDLDESIAASKFPMLTDISKATSEITDRQIKLANSEPGSGHDNYLHGIRVAYNMRMSAKMMVEAERYHFLDIVSSNSTMHRIVKFDMDECYNKYVDKRSIAVMMDLVNEYNENPTDDGYLRILYSNPAGFTYTLRFTTSYRQFKTILNQREYHKIPEWRELCAWIRKLPHSYLITGDLSKAI